MKRLMSLLIFLCICTGLLRSGVRGEELTAGSGKRSEKPAKTNAVEPLEASAVEFTGILMEDSICNPMHDYAGNFIEEPSMEVAEELIEEFPVAAMGEPVEETAEEAAEETAEETEEASEEVTEERSEEATEELTTVPTEAPAEESAGKLNVESVGLVSEQSESEHVEEQAESPKEETRAGSPEDNAKNLSEKSEANFAEKATWESGSDLAGKTAEESVGEDLAETQGEKSEEQSEEETEEFSEKENEELSEENPEEDTEEDTEENSIEITEEAPEKNSVEKSNENPEENSKENPKENSEKDSEEDSEEDPEECYKEETTGTSVTFEIRLIACVSYGIANEREISVDIGITGGTAPYGIQLDILCDGESVYCDYRETGETIINVSYLPSSSGNHIMKILVTDEEGRSAYTELELPVSVNETETVEQWEETMRDVELTGDWNTDIVSIADSQLGYMESIENFIIDEDGVIRGYSRYGDRYGSPYEAWSALFVSFCARYAGIPETVFQPEADADAMLRRFEKIGVFHAAGDPEDPYAPEAGDIVFFDLNIQDSENDHNNENDPNYSDISDISDCSDAEENLNLNSSEILEVKADPVPGIISEAAEAIAIKTAEAIETAETLLAGADSDAGSDSIAGPDAEPGNDPETVEIAESAVIGDVSDTDSAPSTDRVSTTDSVTETAYIPVKERKASHVGVIRSTDGGRICTIEGDREDMVTFCEYRTDSESILGYASMSGMMAQAVTELPPVMLQMSPEADSEAVRVDWEIPQLSIVRSTYCEWNTETLQWTKTELSPEISGNISTFTLTNNGTESILVKISFTPHDDVGDAVTVTVDRSEVLLSPQSRDEDETDSESRNENTTDSQSENENQNSVTVTATVAVNDLNAFANQGILGTYVIKVETPADSAE